MPQPLIVDTASGQVAALADRVRAGMVSPRDVPAELQHLSPYPPYAPEA